MDGWRHLQKIADFRCAKVGCREQFFKTKLRKWPCQINPDRAILLCKQKKTVHYLFSNFSVMIMRLFLSINCTKYMPLGKSDT